MMRQDTINQLQSKLHQDADFTANFLTQDVFQNALEKYVQALAKKSKWEVSPGASTKTRARLKLAGRTEMRHCNTRNGNDRWMHCKWFSTIGWYLLWILCTINKFNTNTNRDIVTLCYLSKSNGNKLCASKTLTVCPIQCRTNILLILLHCWFWYNSKTWRLSSMLDSLKNFVSFFIKTFLVSKCY